MFIVGRVTIISLDATYNVRISILDSSISAPLKDLVEVRQVRHLKHDAVPAKLWQSCKKEPGVWKSL